MIKIKVLFFIFLAIYARGAFACNEVSEGYDNKDTMYVVCPNLSDLSNADASNVVHGVMSQYTGPPDEVLVYFVTTTDGVGKSESNLTESELVG